MPRAEESRLHPLAVWTEKFLAHPGTSRPGSDFLDALCCPDASAPMADWNSREIDPDTAAAIQDCLPRLLTKLLPAKTDLASNDVTSVLAGMIHHGCWRICLATTDDTYLLSGAVLCFLDYFWEDSPVDKVVASSVWALLNTWLKPQIPWKDMPSRTEVCQHMFGSAWCSIALPDACLNVHDGKTERSEIIVSQIVLAERPPFLQGVCPSQAPLLVWDLPALGA
jgi:hypothetical protein